MELVQSGRLAMINAIKAPFKETAEPHFVSPAPDTPWADRKVLPPFLGEMGFEIRYFLAAIEPWLRNGWRILAKRPELYPHGTAFTDAALFAEMKAALLEHGGYPIGGVVRTRRERVHIAMETDLTGDGRFILKVNCHGPEDIESMLENATLEVKLRQAFARRYMRAPRPLTPWDTNLLATYDSRPEHMCGGALSLAPSYKPVDFLIPPYPAQPHVGVQMRRLWPISDRDSDAEMMMAKAREAAAYLGLPLLVYGHPDGTVRPEGVPNTADLAGDLPLLRYELSMLSQCRLMLAPESGWCDLMCWLQIPTLLEKLGRPHEFTPNAVFHPRLALLAPGQPVGPQIEALFAARESLPTCAPQPGKEDDMNWDGGQIRTNGAGYVFGL